MKMSLLTVFVVFLLLECVCLTRSVDTGYIEDDGFFKRQHSLVQPYHGLSGPSWWPSV